MQAGRRIAPLRCSKHPSPPGGTRRSGSPGGSPAPRRQAGNSRHAPLQAESQPPRISRSNMSPTPPTETCPAFALRRGTPFSNVCLRPQEKIFRRPQAGAGANSPRRQTFFPRSLPRKAFFLPRPGSCARTTSPHALRNNNMRRRAPLAFSPSASFSGHAPLPRALFFHRARRRTRPFFIYKHPG